MGRTKLAYGVLWFVYILFSFTLFPLWKINVLIPVVPLIGLGGWLFGSTTGLVLIMPALAYHYGVCEAYADILVYYESRAFGTLILIVVVFLTGKLRRNHIAIREAHAALDQTVQTRNRELNDLAESLIKNAEQTRVELGQELHDGIGQYLTGIKLYCSSITDELLVKANPLAALSDTLSIRAEHTQSMIRRAARTLFPVKIGETGLPSALNELAACFEETSNISLSVNVPADCPDIPETTALQLYRICQETVLHILNHSLANRIAVELDALANDYHLIITHNGKHSNLPGNSDVQTRLIEYRLQRISGTLRMDATVHGREKIIYLIPRQAIPVPSC
jgi:signal transduction histidine kinase